MDVLNPDLEEIDGCFYRVNFTDGLAYGKNAERLPYSEFDDVREEEDDEERYRVNEFNSDRQDTYVDNDYDEYEEAVRNSIFRDNGYYIVEYHVARIYFPIIIGKQGGTRMRLEKETKTLIQIPRRNEAGDIIIRSKQVESLMKAYRRIRIMVDTVRRRQDFTHFLSIPLVNDEIKGRFALFKSTVLEMFGCDRGIHEELFQNPAKLHLTIDMLVLVDNQERAMAADALRRCKQLFIDPYLSTKPIKIGIRGVEIMNDDPSDVRVLYGKITTNDNFLQQLVDNISNFFAKTDFTNKTKENIKLHVTVMNARYVSLRTDHVERKNHSFDARNILKEFENYEFGECVVNQILLSQLHTTGPDGYFETSSKILFS